MGRIVGARIDEVLTANGLRSRRPVAKESRPAYGLLVGTASEGGALVGTASKDGVSVLEALVVGVRLS